MSGIVICSVCKKEKTSDDFYVEKTRKGLPYIRKTPIRISN